MVAIRGRLAILAPLVGLAVSGCLEPTLFEGAHYEVPSMDHLTGYLTWSNGEGGIAWDVNADSDDPGGPSDPSQGVKAAAGRLLHGNTGDDHDLVPVDEFTSDPVASLVHLNASRFIRVTLYVKAPECVEFQQDTDQPVRLDVELYLNDTFLGGALGGIEGWWDNPYVEGHCLLLYEIHPELEQVPAGARLRLRVLHRSHAADLQYGLAGLHRSTVVLPYYAEEEVRVRFPDPTARKGFCDGGFVFDVNAPYQHKDEVGVGESAPAAGLFPVGLLALVALPQAFGRRRLASATLILVLGVAFSGCVNPVATPHPAASGALLGEGHGSIEGLVCSDFDLPVGGAHIALLGTNFYADTDVKGIFQFSNVTVGPHVLRVEHDEFDVLEYALVAAADTRTLANLTLKSRNGSGPNERPHVHDAWGSKTVIPLWSGDVEFNQYDPTLGLADPKKKGGACLYAGDNLYSPNGALGEAYCFQEFFLPERPDGLPAIVVPGTNEIEIQVTWNPEQNHVPRVGIAYSSNVIFERFDPRPILAYPRGNGETTHLRTNWDMTDQGHQEFTMWRFFLYIPTGTSGTLPGASLTQLVQGPFHVEMKLHRGVVPLEPSHRDFWGDQTKLEVLPASQLNPYCPFWEPQQFACHLPDPNVGWRLWNKMIPPETRWLEMTMQVQNPTMHLPAHDWGLVYKPANKPRTVPASDYVRAVPVDAGQNPLTYRVMVTPEETDQYYQLLSNWAFLPDDLQDHPHMSETDVLLTLTVVAHRTPPP